MKLLETQIQIDATPERVWAILTDLEQYADWNPFIFEASGTVAVGKKLVARMRPPNGRPMKFTPTVQSAVENSEFSWLGRVLLPGIFDGKHIFKINPNETGCLFEQNEEFRGILVPFLWKDLSTNVRKGFELMNQALKERAEREI